MIFEMSTAEYGVADIVEQVHQGCAGALRTIIEPLKAKTKKQKRDVC